MKTCSVIFVSALVELVAATDVEKVDDERMPACPAGYRLYDGGSLLRPSHHQAMLSSKDGLHYFSEESDADDATSMLRLHASSGKTEQ
ncbi:hypothetical protein GQ602_002624 [Ophiocordyceps camponoti-floridani]|uniref:Uncharacterized protein n=1 Tax=Ophiocordyceps camponoti-floridani TaxID=2030778 RepID=A0A8H4QAW4_9HYPO|nr:hypothetical protein GQ602_002624 [Ophiocordyceps camponoti-floridani]